MRKVTVSRMRERYAQTVLTFRITCLLVVRDSVMCQSKWIKRINIHSNSYTCSAFNCKRNQRLQSTRPGPSTADSGLGEINYFLGPLPFLSKGAHRPKILTLNQKEWHSVAECLGLVLRGLICTIVKQRYYRDKKHMQHSRVPFWTSGKVETESGGTRRRTGGEVKGKEANGVGSQAGFILTRNSPSNRSRPTRTPRKPVLD